MLGIPVFIGLAWFLILSAVSTISKNVFFAIFLTIFIDVLVERFAAANNFWVWLHNTEFTAPTQNYLIWGIVAALYFFPIKKQKFSINLSCGVLLLLVGYMTFNLFLLNSSSLVLGLVLVIIVLFYSFFEKLKCSASNFFLSLLLLI